MAALIRLENVNKIYETKAGQVTALDNISLEIREGEFVAIVGQSGSGKSTLMNILGCLDTPDSGHYFLGGRDMTRCSPALQAQVRGSEIGFIFQGFHLIPSLSAQENVELPLV